MQLRVKRALDLVLASIFLILLSPVVCLIAIAIKVDSRGPVLFVATRSGLNARAFRMFKFRSMCLDAEEQLAGLTHLNAGGDRLIRIADDPRVTRFGAVLRRTSLDELPQLANVIRGDMSLVGPRPQSPSEVALYTDRERERLRIRPGMTGLWQVTSRDNPSFDEWIRLDLEYILNWSLWLDLKILAITPSMVIRTARRSTGSIH